MHFKSTVKISLVKLLISYHNFFCNCYQIWANLFLLNRSTFLINFTKLSLLKTNQKIFLWFFVRLNSFWPEPETPGQGKISDLNHCTQLNFTFPTIPNSAMVTFFESNMYGVAVSQCISDSLSRLPKLLVFTRSTDDLSIASLSKLPASLLLSI